MVRREERQADYDFNMDDFSILGETVTLETVETEPTFFVGAGFDLYFKHNLAARAELRWRIAENKARSSQVLLVGARYFF